MKDPLNWFKGQEDNKTERSIQIKSIDEIPDKLSDFGFFSLK